MKTNKKATPKVLSSSFFFKGDDKLNGMEIHFAVAPVNGLSAFVSSDFKEQIIKRAKIQADGLRVMLRANKKAKIEFLLAQVVYFQKQVRDGNPDASNIEHAYHMAANILLLTQLGGIPDDNFNGAITMTEGAPYRYPEFRI